MLCEANTGLLFCSSPALRRQLTNPPNMEFVQSLAAIKQLIGQGNLEEAYNQLVLLLETTADYAELADIARVNQADLYQLKAQNLKGTIAPEDARLASNQLADKALQIVRQLETGKIMFEENIKPHSSKAWRYYVIGGMVTLAAAMVLWLVFGKNAPEDECPAFSKTAELKVMILPFKQTGKDHNGDPAIDIMDGLNDLIDQTPGLRVRAIADVNEHYDIDKDYPNSAQAMEIARHCNAQMLVWGKVKQFNDKEYILDVRYRLLDAGGVRSAGDTTISRLLAVTEEGGWIRDVRAINRLLYMVLANQMQAPIAASILEEFHAKAAAAVSADSMPLIDTSTSFILADRYIMNKQTEAAIAEYDKVLQYYPSNATALKKRGALLLQREDFTAAAQDLEAVTQGDQKVSGALRAALIEALLGSNQPEKAKKEVESARKDQTLDGTWLEQKSQEIQDSTVALQERRDLMERRAATKARDLSARVGAARANLGLGETDDALRYAKDALRIDPKNIEAVQVAVEAHLQKGDTAKATQTIERAARAGATVKTIQQLQSIRTRVLPEKKE